MPKVCVLGPVDDEERTALLKLLAEAGCDVVDEEVAAVEPGEGEDDEGEDGEHVGIPLRGRRRARRRLPEDDADRPHADDEAPVTPRRGRGLGGDRAVSDCLADEELGRVMQRAAAQGRRVIGIWPPGTQDETLPRAFEDYGGDTVPGMRAACGGAYRGGTRSPSG